MLTKLYYVKHLRHIFGAGSSTRLFYNRRTTKCKLSTKAVPKITINPNKVLVDENLHIIVNGLTPRQRVTLVSRVNEKGSRFYAYAYYVSDDIGQVDLKTMPAVEGGSYTGIEPMGLVWSQKQEPGQRPGRRLAKEDVQSPITTHVYVLNDFVVAGDCVHYVHKEKWLASALCERLYMAEGIQRIEVCDGNGRHQGTLFIPKGPGPFPGVIDLFGLKGGITEHRSALLASRGIAAYALGYIFPEDPIPETIPIEYFEEAIEYMLKHPKVKKPHVGIIGVSKGADVALLTTSLCHQIKACVEINGGHMVTGIPHTYKGEFFQCMKIAPSDGVMIDGAYSLQPICYSDNEKQKETFVIPVEKGECEYLLIHGTDDQTVATLTAEYIPKRLREHNKTNYRVLLYPGAGHLIEPPYSPLFFMTYNGIHKCYMLWGGHTRQHAKAQDDAWKKVLNFFKENI